MREFKKLIKRTDSPPVNDRGCATYHTRYRHSQGYKGRLYAEGAAVSKTPMSRMGLAGGNHPPTSKKFGRPAKSPGEFWGFPGKWKPGNSP